MKTKEVIQLLAAVIIFAIAGFIIYSQLSGGKSAASNTGPTIEKVTKIPRDYDSDALSKLADSSKARDFYAEPNLNSGLGNTQLFNPLR